MSHSKLRSTISFLSPIVLIFFIFILPILKPGLIVGGDWTFPYTNNQLKQFSNDGLSLWRNREIPTGTQNPHQNTYPFNLIAGVWANVGLSGVSFQKTTLFLTIIGIYLSSYLLLYRLTKHKSASVIGALSYLFSPLVFNYINMGWNLVLLFLALAPLFTLVAIDYFKLGGTKRAVILGLLCALGFAQSQSIVWLPIIYVLVFVYQIKLVNLPRQILRLFFGSVTIAITTFIIHAPWIITSLQYMDASFKTTSNFDTGRFSSVISLLNSFRGWGSLFNQQFEFAFPSILVLFSFFPIFLIIYSAIINKTDKLQRLYYFAISLILITPLIFLFHENIARIPFSSVIRDSSRFLVITSLGLSIGTALSLSAIKNRTILLGFVLCLVLSVYPFFTGNIYSVSISEATNKYIGKDFRLRLLNIPMETYEDKLVKYSGQVNLILPTGGSMETKSDSRFKEDFWEVYDPQATFSPYSSGIYISDKSNPLVMNFANNLRNTENNILQTKKFLSIYGVNNIFNRANLRSSINISPTQKNINAVCSPVENQDSDWSITEICHFENAYPIVYTSTSPIYSSDSILDIINNSDPTDKKLAVVGCPEVLEMNGQMCGPATPYVMARTAPNVKITSLSATKYVVNLSNISGRYILVLNKTFHPGWRVTNKDGVKLTFDHLLINQLVNGWVVEPIQGQTTTQYIIGFYPQDIYSRLFPVSTTIFFLLALYILVGLKRKK